MEDRSNVQHLALTQNLMTDLAKLIRKLRWIGLEDEAHQLEVAVSKFPPLTSADSADGSSSRH